VTRLFDNDMFKKVVQMVHPPFMTSKLGFSPSLRRNIHLSIFYYIFQKTNNLVPSFFSSSHNRKNWKHCFKMGIHTLVTILKRI
jgi:hypothetical protein